MRLVMTLLVRDEVDIVAENLRFHLARGVDFVVATDNGSRDGTREVLAEFEREGRVRVLDEPAQDYAQGRWVTRMALMARDEYGADWVLNNDADEFWLPRSGDLKAGLGETRANLLHCRRRNLLAAHDAPEEAPWPSRVRYQVAAPRPPPSLADRLRDPFPCPYLYWELHRKALCATAGLQEVVQGNHAAEFEQGRRGAAHEAVTIHHVPFRSREGFLRKVHQGGAAYARNQELPSHLGWHWRRWFALLEEGREREVLDEVVPDQARLARDLAGGVLAPSTSLCEALGAP